MGTRGDTVEQDVGSVGRGSGFEQVDLQAAVFEQGPERTAVQRPGGGNGFQGSISRGSSVPGVV